MKDKKVILYIGRLEPQKRVDLCIQAFGEVLKEIGNIFLVIGGQGKEEKILRNLVRVLKLEEKVRFVGYVKEKELWDYYACCDVFVSLDQQDFDIAPYEALGLGKKVVLSNEMEIEDILDDNRFIFITSMTVSNVAEVMKRALNTELKTLTIKERKNLYNYTWDNYSRRMLIEIQKALC